MLIPAHSSVGPDLIGLDDRHTATELTRAPLSGDTAVHDDRVQPLSLSLRNLLNDANQISDLLLGELRNGNTLDAFLFSAALLQICDDFASREVPRLDRISKVLPRSTHPAVLAAVRFTRFAMLIERQARDYGITARRLRRLSPRLKQLVDVLAGLVIQGNSDQAALDPNLTNLALYCFGLIRQTPRLAREIVRLPTCFGTFDQRPGDVAKLTDRFIKDWPDRRRGVGLVGIRSSGSYVAPLAAAALRIAGYTDVAWTTVRPGQHPSRAMHEYVKELSGRNGLLLVTDDPPATGASVAKVAKQLEEIGANKQSIVLLLALFGPPESLPEKLKEYRSVLLPWTDWSVQADLRSEAIVTALHEFGLLDADSSTAERVTPIENCGRRSHIRAVFRINGTDRPDLPAVRYVAVEGVGIGYFGAYSRIISQELQGAVPRTGGLRNGLVYREWLPDEERLSDIDRGALQIAEYVALRQSRLAVLEDFSLRLHNRRALWQRASDLIARSFGRAAPIVRPILHATAKALVRTRRPSLIDGNMRTDQWFWDHDAASLIKVGYASHAFSSRDWYSFDALSDLAEVAASCTELDSAKRLRGSFEALTESHVDEDKWLIYQLLHLDRMESEQGPSLQIEARRAQVIQQFIAATIFGDVEAPSGGPLCAFDLDGTLESYSFGCAAISPGAAIALRALTLHGFRPVIATGRSLGEVSDRCQAYRLAGGVAEYGAAFQGSHGPIRSMLDADQKAALARLQTALLASPNVLIDASFHSSLRAYVEKNGVRASVPDAITQSAFDRSGTSVKIYPIQGERQTDFVPMGINKAIGLRALAEMLGAESWHGKELALAVGDTTSDVPMLRMASIAVAPAHASELSRVCTVHISRRQYQGAVLEAAGILLGHKPGSCRVCHIPELPFASRLLLTALSAQDRGRFGKLLCAAILMKQVAWHRLRIPLFGENAGLS